MEEVFYKKVGRKYVPVSYYDSDVSYSFTLGSHLVVKRDGMTMYRMDIDPAVAPLVAAGIYAEEAIVEVMRNACEARPSHVPITEEEQEAWKQLTKAMGDARFYLQYPAIQDAARAGVKALIKESEELLSNPTVRAAYEQFLFVCELAKKEKQNG